MVTIYFLLSSNHETFKYSFTITVYRMAQKTQQVNKNDVKNVQELLDKAIEEDKEYPETFVFDTKDKPKLYGRVMEHKEIELKGDISRMIIVEELETKNVFTVWLSTVLAKKYDEKKVELKDVVCIYYLGKRVSQAGREYHDFTLAKI